MRSSRAAMIVAFVLFGLWSSPVCSAGTRTWDGRYDTTNIEVTLVYFVPADRQPIADWQDRLKYYARRIEQFHAREFSGQSTLKAIIHEAPVTSVLSTAALREGDANAIYYRTLSEVDQRLQFAATPGKAFPILLVMSEINWRPLDDFHRLKPGSNGFEFEGQNIGGHHFPGAASGGARAAYLADRGIGWGLVSADGWRVPYRGSDCVVYHEGCGHTVGLPHPEPIDDSVMGVAQYEDWISRTTVNREQKIRLGWEPKEPDSTSQRELFTTFRAIPNPAVPKPGEEVRLNVDWPADAVVRRCDVRIQTNLSAPWMTIPQSWNGPRPDTLSLGSFERPTPISYRVDVELEDNSRAELWGYLQVRNAPEEIVLPDALPLDLMTQTKSDDRAPVLKGEPRDLLAEIDPGSAWSQGQWIREDGRLVSPRQYGARIELPAVPFPNYQMTLIVEPLDEPNGLLVGNRMDRQRFVSLFSWPAEGAYLSAIENVDGRNVGNSTTFNGALFARNRLSQIIVMVRNGSVRMQVDGRTIVEWQGNADQLSLSEYWTTPDSSALFLGAYDCRYRYHQILVQEISE